ncbi:sensor histidine kinase [Methylobacterium soli]|uniref:Blue-light-activated histidine kinase n=1 Tax=Methylobacterium soli TaxID=553447 RepID=A0A6L3SX10_9HYPH|nr:PAS domain-containing protein [Methylobacterium soli]KAB1078406.1 PAS domain-containing protein [Methylobacterium soli]
MRTEPAIPAAPDSAPYSVPAWPDEGGETGRLLRGRDWSGTALGPLRDWPNHLRLAVDMLLGGAQPAILLWGRTGIALYNDACLGVIGDRHPGTFGEPAARGLPEVWSRFAPALRAREAGAPQGPEAGFPIRGPDGRVAGVLAPVPLLPGAAAAWTLDAAKAERRRSRARLRAAADLAPALLWSNDPGGRVTWCNRRWLDQTGQSLAAALGEGWIEAFHPDDRPESLARFRAALALGAAFEHEQRLRGRDGGFRWFRLRAEPSRDAAGRIRQWFGAAIDVEAERATAAVLRQSEAFHRVAAEAGLIGTWDCDLTAGTCRLSPRAAALLGLDRSLPDLPLAACLDRVRPEDRAGLAAAIDAVGETGAPFDEEFRIVGADGAVRWVHARGGALRDGAAGALHLRGASLDITARRTAEQDLRANEARLKIVLAELQHRVRNSLAVVRSVARRTAETSRSVEDFASHLDGRLNAFARVQSVVVRDPSGGIDLEGLVADELLANQIREGSRARIGGPAIRLTAGAAETLGLAIHELATNALEHGVLSGERGRLAVYWRVEPTEAGPHLVLDWSEQGGRRVRPPTRKGFGLALLERTLGYELKARTRLGFEPAGFSCHIAIPLSPEIALDSGHAPP